jgi:Ti-type conjugative transfer relaxase TraA
MTGFAGAGKSATIAAARDAWQAQGYRVLGGTLSGIAAENPQRESEVERRTLASWERAWRDGRERLTRTDVLVIDEAGMIGSRQLERIISHASDRGAKVVLVGDAEQLQPIEAGAAFRAVAEWVGYQELSAIRRQREFWQREASRGFARSEPARAIDRYHAHRAIHFAEDREKAKAELIGRWSEYRAAHATEKDALILAHTRADVRELNSSARAVLNKRGEPGKEVRVEVAREVMAEDGTVSVERSERLFAVGDRVMFLKNEREIGVKNGSLGTVAEINRTSMRVALNGPDRREVEFALSEYAALDYGYAATVHKAQGATLDRTFLLATPGMDRHLAYVGMTRHREGVEVYAGRDDFRGFDELKGRLSRARRKTRRWIMRSGADWRPRALPKPRRGGRSRKLSKGIQHQCAKPRSAIRSRASRQRRMNSSR